jgi:D-glycero-alpha-D-manno-heptose-7-phosphate kinase
MKTIKKARVPVRIDFAGGTTDIAYFAHKYGGAVLNVAIDKYVIGKLVRKNNKTHLEYTGKIPTASGLGTSGAMNVLWLALIQKTKDKKELADMAYKIEQAMGNVGGKQDHYAAAFGGIQFLEFKKDKVIRTPLKLNSNFVKELENKLVLVYTGIPHLESNANKNMIDNIKKGMHVKNLIRIREIAKEMKTALLKKDLNKFSELLNEETENRIKLDKAVLPPGAKEIMKEGFSNGATAAKICGSGNGGSILFFGDKNKLKRKFGNKVIDFKFDFEGLKIW